ILDYGRPRAVELAVLVDRGHRELPIHADYVGREITTERGWHVDVLLEERDGEDMVRLDIRD
ncbi:MAG: bifunctional pyr operon transcriptional regulator/uracil phosphoribosyltransferase, partial [Desulfovibrio sp.]|nr:bifunctional pyr operon transcriptional regulator/uracil phosphoribosyltransferase [Desulfovibrio sp.]